MLQRILLATAAAALILGLSAAGASAAMIPIYSNPLDSAGSRGQLSVEGGRNCKRGGNARVMRIELGERTGSCHLGPALLGRDLDVSVIGRVLSGTPPRLRGRAYLSAGLRSGEGGALRLRVFPIQKKVQLLQYVPDEERRYLSIVKDVEAIRGVNAGNHLHLRAHNVGPPGNCRVAARVNGRRVLAVDVRRCARMTGRMATIGAGATRGGPGLISSFNRLRISTPSPY